MLDTLCDGVCSGGRVLRARALWRAWSRSQKKRGDHERRAAAGVRNALCSGAHTKHTSYSRASTHRGAPSALRRVRASVACPEVRASARASAARSKARAAGPSRAQSTHLKPPTSKPTRLLNPTRLRTRGRRRPRAAGPPPMDGQGGAGAEAAAEVSAAQPSTQGPPTQAPGRGGRGGSSGRGGRCESRRQPSRVLQKRAALAASCAAARAALRL